MKNVLVIGNGGREHALAWKLSLSPRVQCVYVAPGNGGTALEARVRNISIPVTHLSALADFADREAVDFTVVGPEAPLAAGIVDLFRARGLRIFGPTRACAQLESSKAFAKAFMQRHGIPTAASASFADPESAHPYVERQGAPIVIKADGLAAGKGVVVAHQLDEAHAAIETLFGNGSACVVIEEYLSGEEASFIVMADGEHVLPLASSQDHKRLGDGDTGPNTGGMGAYSPAPVITPQLHARIMREIIWPAVRGMAQEGIRYTGFLYAGLMIDAHGAALAARGYPDAPRCGDMITGLPASTEDVHLFHAGTTQRENQCLTSGGRVLCVTGLADSIEAARARTYSAIAQIHFDGMHYRRDIGARALA